MSARTQYRNTNREAAAGPRKGAKKERELTPIERSLKFPRRNLGDDGIQTVCVFPQTLLSPLQQDFDTARKAINRNLVSKQKLLFS